MRDISKSVIRQNFTCGKWQLSQAEEDFQKVHGWVVQGLASIAVGVFGLVMNIVALHILSKEKLYRKFFNKLLIYLIVFDTCFILDRIYESYVLNMIEVDYCSWQGYGMLVLYPFRQIMLCCSIYITVALALERYLAMHNPITYRRNSITKSDRKRLLKYLIPIIIFSLIFTIPLFFTFKIESHAVQSINNAVKGTKINEVRFDKQNETSRIVRCIEPTRLRKNKKFILWYMNVARLLVTGIVPFLSIVIFNGQTFWKIKSSAEERKSFYSSTENVKNHINPKVSRTTTSKETKHALVLFGIAGVFLMCHLLRIILGMEELLTYDDLTETLKAARRLGRSCTGVQFWTMIANDVSHLLILVNASSNLFIYSFLSKDFRIALKEVATGILRCFEIFKTYVFTKFSVMNKNKNLIAEENRRVSSSEYTQQKLHSTLKNLISNLHEIYIAPEGEDTR